MSRSQKLLQENEITKNSTVGTTINNYLEKIKNSSKQINKSKKMKSQDSSNKKPKVVNKIKHWNNKESNDSACKAESSTENQKTSELTTRLHDLQISPNNSENNLFKPDWLKAKDSLENLLSPRKDKVLCGDIINSRSTSFSSAQERPLPADPPHSEPTLGANKMNSTSSFSKVLAWDPWDKLSRKNKKETKRRKAEKTPLHPRENSRGNSPFSDLTSRKDHTSGDEIRQKNNDVPNEELNQENYEYQPFRPQNTKSVDFTNEVMVVYFTGDEVLGEATEPLKKELEQQIRNKEMRKGHTPATMVGKKKLAGDYMSFWFKK